jgi:hypothetical protein
METKNGVKVFCGIVIFCFLSFSILSGCGLFEKEKIDNSNSNQTQIQKFTDIFTKPPLFDSSKQKYSAGKSRIYPKSSSVSVWEKVIGGHPWLASSIIQSSDGNYVVAGKARDDAYIVKLDSYGNVLWAKEIGTGMGEDGRTIIQDSNGEYVVAGNITGWLNGDIYVMKLDSQGNLQWAKSVGGDEVDYIYPSRSITQSIDGDYVIAGGTMSSFGIGWHDIYLVKLDPEGNVKWAKVIGGGATIYLIQLFEVVTEDM